MKIEFKRKEKGGLSITKMVDCDLEDEVVREKKFFWKLNRF